MANKCGSCGKFASTDSVRCSTCGINMHRNCAVASAEGRPNSKWLCKGCKNKPVSNKNYTPPSCSSDRSDSDTGGETTSGAPDGQKDLDLVAEIKLMRSQLMSIQQDTSSCRQEMSTFRDEILKLNVNIAEFNNRLNCVEEKISNVSKRLSIVEKNSEIFNGTDLTAKIESHLNERDQESFLNDLEITGVPEEANENPSHLITIIAQKVGVTVEERDIVSASRRGKLRGLGVAHAAHMSGAEAGAAARPRTLVVRLARRSLRDQLMHAARTRRGADTAGLIPNAAARRFFINERLTWTNRNIFRRAREEARIKGWRYVWTREGRVYARRSPDSTAYRIRTESDVDKIIKSVN